MTPPASKKHVVATIIGTLSRGGAEKVALSIVNNLDPRRFAPIMITTREPGEIASDLRADIEHFSLYRTKRFDITAVKKLARFLDERGVAIVHSHNHSSSYFCRVVRLFCKNKWKHVVHDHHGPVVESLKMAFLDKAFLKNADLYIGASEALTKRANTTIGIPENKCLYLPNGIAIPEMTATQKNGKLRIIQVGRIEPVKNQMMAIKTIKELKEKGLAFEWVFIGKVNDKEYYAELSEAIAKEGLEDYTMFLGERADIPDLLQKADIGVLTSTHEGLSIAMLEYMAYGLPVVITEVGQSSDIIKSANCGFVIGQNDVFCASQVLMELVQNEDLRIDCGRNNRKCVVGRFGERIMTNKIMNIYDCLMRGD